MAKLEVHVEPPGMSAPPEPYSHAIKVGNTIYVAGQVALDEQNQVVGIGDPAKQAEQCWSNIQRVLEAAGATLADVVKVVVFCKDMREGHHEVELRGKLFKDLHKPVATMVQVANLGWPELLFEVEATAVVE